MQVSMIQMFLSYIRKCPVVPLFWGPPGLGKTQSVKEFCKNNDLKLVILNLGTQEVGDLVGLPYKILENGIEKVKYAVPDWFPTDPNSKGVIFLDEINRAQRVVLQAVFSLILEKRLHQHFLPVGWSIVAAANPPGDDSIVTDIGDRAFMSRFCHILVENNVSDWMKYAKERNLDSSVVNFASSNDKFFTHKNTFSYDDLKPGWRNNELLSDLKKTGIPNDLFKEAVFGLFGTDVGTNYLKYCEEYETSLIRGKDVVHNWNKKLANQIKDILKDKTRMDRLAVCVEEIFNEFDKPEFVIKKDKDEQECYYYKDPSVITHTMIDNIKNFCEVARNEDIQALLVKFKCKKMWSSLTDIKDSTKQYPNLFERLCNDVDFVNMLKKKGFEEKKEEEFIIEDEEQKTASK